MKDSQKLFVIVLGLATVLALMATQAAAISSSSSSDLGPPATERAILNGITQITTEPATPTTEDPIKIMVSGEWNNSCVPEYQSHQIVDNIITINVVNPPFPPTACIAIITPWQIAVEIGTLSAGTYTVRGLISGGEKTTSFKVVQAPALFVDGASGNDSGNNCADRDLPCATIGHTLDQAEEGDTILVAQGTYAENLVITKPITLRGAYETENWTRCLRHCPTTIDGNQSGRVIEVKTTLSKTTTIDGFTIMNGDGGISTTLSAVDIQNSKIVDNHNINSTGSGGGMRIDRSFVSITNTIIADNIADKSNGAIRIVSTSGISGPLSQVNINSSTIANNYATDDDGWNGIFCSNASFRVVNSILWGHQKEDYLSPNSVCGINNFEYSNVETTTVGIGNISADPLFVDAANGDYHLQDESPCIDTGTNDEASPTDFEGDPRPVDGDQNGDAITDMGADEFLLKMYMPIIFKNSP